MVVLVATCPGIQRAMRKVVKIGLMEVGFAFEGDSMVGTTRIA